MDQTSERKCICSGKEFTVGHDRDWQRRFIDGVCKQRFYRAKRSGRACAWFYDSSEDGKKKCRSPLNKKGRPLCQVEHEKKTKAGK